MKGKMKIMEKQGIRIRECGACAIDLRPGECGYNEA